MKIRLLNDNYKDQYILNLLLGRGIDNFDDFMHPTEAFLESPEKLDHIHAAAQRYIFAMEHKENVFLIADSDVDGMTSAAILYNYTKRIWPDNDIDWVYHEHKEHGLSDQIDYLENCDTNYTLVMTPDSGTNDVECHQRLAAIGADIIILDHHEYEGKGIGRNVYCVNNQISPNYENKALSGAGVTWQFCREIDSILGTNQADSLIDLVALGCCADVMSPLTYENRYIFTYGFSHIRNDFFQTLIEKQAFSMKGKINYTTVAFYIAPLLNACVRTGTMEEKQHMYEAFIHPHRLIETKKRGHKPGEMEELCIESARELTNIKARQKKMIDQYESILKYRVESEGLNENKIILIKLEDHDDFSPELNGLIAMKLAAAYKKPVLIGRDNPIEGVTKGSLRNCEGSPIVSLKDFVATYSNTTFVAGHAQASGWGIKTSCLDDFINWANAELANVDFGESYIDVNFERPWYADDLPQLIAAIAECNDIWGGDLKTPKVYIHDLYLKPSDIQVMGKSQDTIKFECNSVECIKFFAKDFIQDLQKNVPCRINFVGEASVNEWMGSTTYQIIISDYELIKDNIYQF